MEPPAGACSRQPQKPLPYAPSTDPSLWALIFSNIVTILVAIYEGWDVGVLFVVYWLQSVAIGLSNVIRMLTLQVSDFNPQVAGDMAGKWEKTGSYDPFDKSFRLGKKFLAGFFLLHYGCFMYGYVSFWGLLRYLFSPEGPYIILASALFFVNHLYSLWYNKADGGYGKDYLAELMFKPYLRIMPMHATLIVGTIIMLALGEKATYLVLVFFLVLKTYADAQTHIWEHRGGMSQFMSKKSKNR